MNAAKRLKRIAKKLLSKLYSFLPWNEKLMRECAREREISIMSNMATLLSGTDNKILSLKNNLKLIEIETFTYCNRRCWFCPNHKIDRHSNNQYMEEHTYLNLLTQLVEIDYNGILTYSRYNEPFSDKIILKRIAQAREMLPNTNLYTHTNGDYLTKDYMREIRKAGLNTLKIQYYLNKEERYNKFVILENMKRRIKKFAENYTISQFEDDYVGLQIQDEKMSVIYEAINFNLFACNRGESLNFKHDFKRNVPCLIPFANIYIDFNGNCMPCCNLRSDIDQHKNFILGNANSDSLANIFFNEKSLNFRKNLFANNIEFKPCSSCNYGINVIPKNLSNAP